MLTFTLEAFIVRNVGGSVRPNIGDIIYTDVSVNFTLEEIIIIHHDGMYVLQVIEQCWFTGSDCGTQHLSAQAAKNELKARLPNAESEIDKLEFPTHFAEE
jgi:carbonic anhydrase